jgi:hypothetical protein
VPGLRLSGDPFNVAIGDKPAPSLDWAGVYGKGLYLGIAKFTARSTGPANGSESTALVELTKTADTAPPGQGGGGGGTPGGSRLTIKVSKLRLARDRRTLRARVKLSLPAKVSARAKRGKAISRGRARSVKRGTHTVKFHLTRKLKRGRTYSVRFSALAPGQPVARRTVRFKVPRG